MRSNPGGPNKDHNWICHLIIPAIKTGFVEALTTKEGIVLVVFVSFCFCSLF
jgi:hypothetical protein